VSSIILTIGGLAVSILAIAARVYFYRSGKEKERLKNAEQTLEDVAKGNIAAATDDYDTELQERYK